MDFATSPYEGKETGEQALLRQLLSRIREGDIMLGDANFENYFLLVLLRLAGADVVFEKHGSRHIDFRCDKKLGKTDGLFVLKRPACPEWMSRTFYEQFTPKELTVRAIKSRKRIIMTTLVDDKRYTRAEINALYLKRWHVELDLRSMKTLMKMDVLRCKSPDMVRVQGNFSVPAGLQPTAGVDGSNGTDDREDAPGHQLQSDTQTLQDFHSLLLSSDPPAGVIEAMLNIIAEHQVGNRPGRSEPRAVKRRPKAFPKLQHTRPKARRLKKYQGKAA
ncbi:transposase [Sansalvadorimonas verongulae]|uniref:transposase n=1 Tax=Sansalvadorimonas verongulae TaxID=2172824 RepID=UPI001E2FA809|nr:transposase [Sansalvadorimonas verongulae]